MSDQPRQSVIVDIHEYYRVGGIDWPRAADNFDAIGIRCCVGMEHDDLFFYHVEKAVLHDMIYFTYAVPQAFYPPDEQVDFYLETDGVADHAVVGDIEESDGDMVSEYQARKFFERLIARQTNPWYYSNYYYTSKLGFPQWIQPLVKWWAEYPYDILTKYRKWERYLIKNPWKIPKWAVKAGYTPEFHQLTDYGDARHYLANAATDDPKWRQGIKSCDLTVSLIDDDESMSLLIPGQAMPSLEQRVEALEQQVAVLEGFHN